MVGFFFVKIDLSMLLYVCIQDLFNNEKGLFNMINFMKCNCKVVLLWVRSEFVQELVGFDFVSGYCCGIMENIRLVCNDKIFLGFFIY